MRANHAISARRPRPARSGFGRFRIPIVVFVCAFVLSSGTAAYAYLTTSASSASTTIASGSNGHTLGASQAIDVASTTGFRGGSETIGVVSSAGMQTVTCTGTSGSPVSFTGCTGGTGTLATGNLVTTGAEAIADSLNGGNTPTLGGINGENVTINWTQSTIVHGGQAATGYQIARYNAATGGTKTAGTNGCSGTISALTCTENNVTPGNWWYTVTPVYDAWTGAESGRLAVTVVAPTFSISSGQSLAAASGGAITGGTLANFGNTEIVTFHLDSATGTLLTTSPNTVTTNGTGSASVTSITIPSGQTTGNHTIVAVGATSGLTATSNTFNVYGAPSQLVFTTPPGNGTGGSALSTQPTVTIEDSGGNTVTNDTNSITLIAINSSNQGALLSCTTNPLGATSGAASFGGCKINTAGTYTLMAVDVADGLQIISGSGTISVGSATQIGFVQQPSGATSSGGSFPTQPKVAIEDAGGNTVTSASASITLTLQGSGTLAGCTSAVNTASGVATFSGCNVTGTLDILNDTLKATATGGFSGTATSASFNISGAATHPLYVSQPTVAANGDLSTFQVGLYDASGNLVTAGTGTVSLSIKSGTGTSGAVLTCNGSTSPTATVSYGVATFSGCGINKTDTGYVLTGTDSALSTTTVNSNAFNVGSISAPTITFPTATNQINPGHNGTGNFAIIGTNFANGETVPTNGSLGTVSVNTWINSNIVIVRVTGSGGNGATGNVTVTNPDGGSVTVTNGFVNG